MPAETASCAKAVKDLYVKGGYDAAKDKPKICQEYIGVTDHKGESTKVDDGKSQWGTSTCKLQRSDVKSFRTPLSEAPRAALRQRLGPSALREP